MAQAPAFRAVRDSSFARDPAVSETTVTLNTSLWSSRKKNIVIDSIRTGVAACGWQTGHMIREMLQGLGSDVQQIAKWLNIIDTKMVKPDVLEDLLAYTCAWIKLTAEPTTDRRYYADPLWREKHFVSLVDQGETPDHIPLPRHLSDAEKREFVMTYLRDPSETDRIARETLIQKIKTGDTIQLKFAA